MDVTQSRSAPLCHCHSFLLAHGGDFIQLRSHSFTLTSSVLKTLNISM